MDEVYCEFVCVFLCAFVLFINGFATEMMVELVKNHEWVAKHVAVEDSDGCIFCSVAAINVISVSFWQAYFESRRF